MIFLGMGIEEIQQQIASDYIKVTKWVQSRATVIREWFCRQKDVSTNIMRWKSPNNNIWYVMLWRVEGKDPELSYFTVVESNRGKFVFHPQLGNNAMCLIIFLPHFIKRYRERAKLSKSMTTMQVIRRYLRRNSNGSANSYRNGKRMMYEVTTNDGVGLGVWVGMRARLMKTFITRDMSYGKQVERYEELEARRKTIIEGQSYYNDDIAEEMKLFGLNDAEFMERWTENNQLNQEENGI